MQQPDYDDLPGTRDMASGPGLLSGGHYDRANGGGTLLYSDDKPDQSVFGSAQRAGDTAAPKAKRPNEPPAEKSPSPERQASEFSDFREFQAYERFQKLPEDSAEKQRFEQWQQWQQYQRWEKRQQQ
ncbi:hypothetical protein V5738_08325 [Salinisphaera sp. SPP-AMP-43]|uniref:hypothetical protein n=1 Tax=Salinisphaera sp. SPP-AMP-43 TaxID=3121288 RepID=UPI003C6DDE55